MSSVRWYPRENRLSAFVSYSAEARMAARSLEASLKQFFVDCFMAEMSVDPLEDWEEEIRSALMVCDCGLALISGHFASSAWANQEVGYLLGRGCPVLPLKLGGTPPGFLGRVQGFDASGQSDQNVAAAIFRMLLSYDVLARRYLAMLEQRIVEVRSERDAGEVVAVLKMVPWCPDDWSSRIADFAKNESSFWRSSFRLAGLLDALERLMS